MQARAERAASREAPRRWWRSLIQRRRRRGTWAYAVWLVVYIAFVAFVSTLSGPSAWLLLAPGLLVALLQWLRPTLLSWAALLLPTIGFTAVGGYFVLATNLGAHPRWEEDPAGAVASAVFLALLMGLCVALFFARPILDVDTEKGPSPPGQD